MIAGAPDQKPVSRTASKREMLRWYHHRYAEKIVELAKSSKCSCHTQHIKDEAFKLLKEFAAEVRRYS